MLSSLMRVEPVNLPDTSCWGGGGGSMFPCSQEFCGHVPVIPETPGGLDPHLWAEYNFT